MLPLVIEGIFTPGCGSWDDTMNLITKTVSVMSIPVEIKERIISTAEEAVEYRFLGSPSVRVDRNDIDPEAKNREDFGLG